MRESRVDYTVVSVDTLESASQHVGVAPTDTRVSIDTFIQWIYLRVVVLIVSPSVNFYCCL
jgi:hypothetical protein